MNAQKLLPALAAFMKSNDLSYNQTGKDKFKRDGLKALRALAKEMGFRECEVRFNAGGIAVSGDLSMYGMIEDGVGVVVYLSQGAFSEKAGYCRHIKSLNDYAGGANVWLSHAELFDAEELKKKLFSVAWAKGRLFA